MIISSSVTAFMHSFSPDSLRTSRTQLLLFSLLVSAAPLNDESSTALILGNFL